MRMKLRLCLICYLFALCFVGGLVNDKPASANQQTQSLIINHTCADITRIPEWAITLAKDSLHIAFAHTSHGGQLWTGMLGLVDFANGGGLGLSLPADIFEINWGGTGGALDFRDQAMPGDLTDYPDWEIATRDYLGPPDSLTGRGTLNTEINVIIWCWCWSMGYKYLNNLLNSEYLTPMSQLEQDYPGIVFVYMTSYSHTKTSFTLGNQVVREFCIYNNKVLYDFEDIESYNPDGTFFEFTHDNCDYYDSPEADSLLGNWAIEWQDSHILGVDWYDCESNHSQPLNANLKAYASWWLWARLVGWAGATAARPGKPSPSGYFLSQNYPNPFNPVTTIYYELLKTSPVVVKIYNVRGDEIDTLVRGIQSAGPHRVIWDGRDADGRQVSSGIYLYRLRAGGFDQTRKMVLIR
jgi:hypothetical protein